MRHTVFPPRETMLTLYGDYVRHKGGEIGIGSLVRLVSNFGLSENAVRSAVSRMCRSGLLKAKRADSKSYYSLTSEGHSLLNEGARRIFQRKMASWDGTWNIVSYSIPEKNRDARDRLRTELGWLGYGPLSEATWISPHDQTKEVEHLAEKLKVRDCVQIFHGRHTGLTDPSRIVSRCWELPRIHQKYSDFLATYQPKLESHRGRVSAGETIKPSECFVARFSLIHEYRKLPFFDPDLPLELLPKNWLRPQATALFDEYHDLLTEKANEYFDSVSREYLDRVSHRSNRKECPETGKLEG